MSWLHIVDNNTFLVQLFPTAEPPLRSIRLHEVVFHQDGPRVLFRFDLNTFPEHSPSKWAAAGANTVQVRLMAVGIDAIGMNGWATNNVGELRMTPRQPGVSLEFSAPFCHIVAQFAHIRVDSVTAYTSESA